jgi:hypothetical protein
MPNFIGVPSAFTRFVRFQSLQYPVTHDAVCVRRRVAQSWSIFTELLQRSWPTLSNDKTSCTMAHSTRCP